MVPLICRGSIRASTPCFLQNLLIRCIYGAMLMCWTWSWKTLQRVCWQVDHFFPFLNNTAIFLWESCQRMSIWENKSKDPKHKCLTPIGETGWWSKDGMLRKVFEDFGKPDSAMCVALLFTLSAKDQTNFNTKAWVRAQGFIKGLLKYETILTAQIFLMYNWCRIPGYLM